jgi:hypothetical protein
VAHLPDKSNNYLTPALAVLEKNTWQQVRRPFYGLSWLMTLFIQCLYNISLENVAPKSFANSFEHYISFMKNAATK